MWIDETPNEPGRGDAIDFRARPSHPHFLAVMFCEKSRSRNFLSVARSVNPLQQTFDLLGSRRIKKIDPANAVKFFLLLLQLDRQNRVQRILRQDNLRSGLKNGRILPLARRIEESDKFFDWTAPSISRARIRGRFAAQVAHLLGQPLEKFILRGADREEDKLKS